MANVKCKQVRRTLVICDKQGAIALAKNYMHHARTKHIGVQHHFVKEKIEGS